MENIYKTWVLNNWENPMNVEKEVWLDSVVLEKTGLVIKFNSDNEKYVFRFPCLSPFRIIDEAYRLGLWTVMKNQGILGTRPTWIVNGSDFIQNVDLNGEWGYFNPLGKHYLFITSDIVIDVLSSEEPGIVKEKID